MSDTYQVDQSATQVQPSSPGVVAPSPSEQGNSGVPESSPAQGTGQPASLAPAGVVRGESQQVEEQPEQQASSDVDFRAQYEQERQANLRNQQEMGRYREIVGQIQRAAEEQQQNNAIQQQIDMMLATADNMSPSEGAAYLRNQIKTTLSQVRNMSQQELHQERLRHEAEKRMIAAPQYADHLIQSLGIPPEAKQELLNLGDPDLMYRQAPVIKERYDQFNQQRKAWEQSQQQLARSQEVTTLRQNGLAAIGGQGAGGAYQLEVSDDPDERAMQILNHLRQREQGRA